MMERFKKSTSFEINTEYHIQIIKNPKIHRKDYNVLIDGQSFYEIPL